MSEPKSPPEPESLPEPEISDDLRAQRIKFEAELRMRRETFQARARRAAMVLEQVAVDIARTDRRFNDLVEDLTERRFNLLLDGLDSEETPEETRRKFRDMHVLQTQLNALRLVEDGARDALTEARHQIRHLFAFVGPEPRPTAYPARFVEDANQFIMTGDDPDGAWAVGLGSEHKHVTWVSGARGSPDLALFTTWKLTKLTTADAEGAKGEGGEGEPAKDQP